MSAFLGEIRLFSMNFPPKGWAFCDGQLLPINQNQALFALLGTTYGGNGQTVFALPDLRGRVPVHHLGSFTLGTSGGTSTHTLSVSELPTHTHALNATAANGATQAPAGNLMARNVNNTYALPNALAALRPGTVTSVGNGQAHENRMPSRALNFCIALQGEFPGFN